MAHAQTHIVAPGVETEVREEIENLQNRIDTALERSDFLLREIGTRHRTSRRRRGREISSTPLDGAQPDRESSSERRRLSPVVPRGSRGDSGTRRGTSLERRHLSPVVSRELEETESNRGYEQVPPEDLSEVGERTGSLLPEQTIREAVNSYMENLTHNTVGSFKVPPVEPPKYKVGGDWRCFLEEFREMIELADLRPSHQLAYFKQAVPDEAKKMLYQHKVETVQQAIQILTELYEPVKDTWTVLQELEKISQKPGERLRVFAGRIEEVARRYGETLPTTTTEDLNKLITSRFKHGIVDEETRNHSLWDPTEMTLDMMVQKAQQFEDARKSSKFNRKSFRATGDETENERLKKEISELKTQIEELFKMKSPSKKSSILCWNCGNKGHFSRNCPQKKIGDGFTHRPKRKFKPRTQGQTSSETQTLN